MLHTRTEYDADLLLEHVGPDTFFEIGGRRRTEVVYEIDKDRFEAKAAAGVIDPDVVVQVRKTTTAYRRIPKIVP